jgi:hypothetical protein
MRAAIARGATAISICGMETRPARVRGRPPPEVVCGTGVLRKLPLSGRRAHGLNCLLNLVANDHSRSLGPLFHLSQHRDQVAYLVHGQRQPSGIKSSIFAVFRKVGIVSLAQKEMDERLWPSECMTKTM